MNKGQKVRDIYGNRYTVFSHIGTTVRVLEINSTIHETKVFAA